MKKELRKPQPEERKTGSPKPTLKGVATPPIKK